MESWYDDDNSLPQSAAVVRAGVMTVLTNTTSGQPCLACLSVHTTTAFRLETSWFYRCIDCRSLFCASTQVPRDPEKYHQEETAALYNLYYDGLRSQQACRILDGLRELLPAPARLLDVGCGNGLFVAKAAATGYVSRGIDTSLPPSEACHVPDRLSRRPAKEEARSGERYDVVTLLNVLEHVPNPDSFLADVVSVLRPGGVFICSLPLSNGTVYTLCEWLYRLTGGSAAVPLKTVLQWHMAAPHVFLPTAKGVRVLMQRHFNAVPEVLHHQRIVDVRNLTKRIALERQQRHVTLWENALLMCGGHVMGLLSEWAALCGRPDEVFFFVRRPSHG